MTEPPRPDVLAERISGLSDRIGGIEVRMSELATEKTLIALIEGRDRTVGAHLKALQDDVAQLTAALATERSERIAADRENEERTKSGKMLALTSIGLVISAVAGLVALIGNLGGTPV